MRQYAKVCEGFDLLYLGFFRPNTEQENKVAAEIQEVLSKNDNATASVSAECTGALADLPVIGEFPLIDFNAPTVREVNRQLTEKQMELLREACGDGGALIQRGQVTRAANALLKREWIEVCGERWVATKAGRERAGVVIETVVA